MVLPQWVSTRNYGVFVDNPGTALVCVGISPADRIKYASDAGELSYYVHFGDSMYDVIDQYTQVTGRPLLAPRWTFGNIQSRYGYYSFDDTSGQSTGSAARDIPVDGIAVDLYWFGRQTMGNLEFQDTYEWENPVERIQGIHDQGIKLVPITEPTMSGESYNAAEVIANGLVARESDGVSPAEVYLSWITPYAYCYIMDFTNPATRACGSRSTSA
jgi:alpha-glucosidase (family GH31 glycosyl hydrolase)